mgnify:CR=1 FL=1
MEKNNKTLNVPHLRFPEFSGEWERKSLSDLVIRVTRKNKNNESRLPLTISAQYGLVDQISFFNKVVASNDMSNYYLLHNGEFAYNKSYSGDYPWGAIKRLDRYEKGALSSLYICFAPQQVVHSDFLVHYFESPKWHKEVSNIAGEGARNHGLLNIAVPDFFNTRHWVPSNRTEQEKIAALFNLIEERIQTQKKIIEKYESLIRGLCEKLTRQGTPNKTITECLECHSSTLQESAVLDAGSYPVYGAIGICGYTVTPDVSGDGILIIKDGASVGVTYFADGSYSFIGTLNRLTAKDDINLRYVYYCLKVLNFTPYKTGLAIPHIYFKDYGKHKIWCPILEQQSSIADALTAIDNKIQVEKSLLEQLNSQKRYMLNQLFI